MTLFSSLFSIVFNSDNSRDNVKPNKNDSVVTSGYRHYSEKDLCAMLCDLDPRSPKYDGDLIDIQRELAKESGCPEFEELFKPGRSNCSCDNCLSGVSGLANKVLLSGLLDVQKIRRQAREEFLASVVERRSDKEFGKKLIMDMHVGDHGFAVPWAYDKHTKSLGATYSIRKESAGTACLCVGRESNGYILHLTESASSRLNDLYNDYDIPSFVSRLS